MTNSPVFPFSAVVGHDDMKLALLLNAIDRRIGGVLLRGQKGSAKTTLARALAALLPGGSAFVELPLSSSEDRVVGSLDLTAALTEGTKQFHPGLLAEADNGVLYVDEINLLPDHLVDVLLDVAASGVNRVEREGMSESHASRFVLVGSMNPEEGELRPQLLDRFGFAVDVVSSVDVTERVQAVRRRLDFDADPVAFAERWASDDGALADRLADSAPAMVPEALQVAISQLCVAVGTEGLRADIVLSRAAAAYAGWEGRTEATVDDVKRVAPLVLAHRRRRQPFDDPGITPEEIDQGLEPPSDSLTDPTAGDDPTQGRDTDQGDTAQDDTAQDDTAQDDTAQGDTDQGDTAHGKDTTPAGDTIQPKRGAGDHAADTTMADAPTRVVPFNAPRSTGTAQASGRRTVMTSTRGRQIGDRVPQGALNDVAVGATVRAAAVRRAVAPAGLEPQSAGNRPPTENAAFAGNGTSEGGTASAGNTLVVADDLREAVREQKTGHLLILAVDASGSMGAARRMEAVKGAVVSLLLDAYQRRDRVALVTFGGDKANVVLRPTGSVEVARARLEVLATGGRTPLAAGIEAALSVATSAPPSHRPFLILISDGRATSAPEGSDPLQAAMAAAAKVRRSAVPSLVLDVEDGPLRLGLASQLADAMGGSFLPLHELSAGSLTTTIKQAALGQAGSTQLASRRGES
jgi:magnesium chelatase subunit D